jgi:hypothetical protein
MVFNILHLISFIKLDKVSFLLKFRIRNKQNRTGGLKWNGYFYKTWWTHGSLGNLACRCGQRHVAGGPKETEDELLMDRWSQLLAFMGISCGDSTVLRRHVALPVQYKVTWLDAVQGSRPACMNAWSGDTSAARVYLSPEWFLSRERQAHVLLMVTGGPVLFRARDGSWQRLARLRCRGTYRARRRF